MCAKTSYVGANLPPKEAEAARLQQTWLLDLNVQSVIIELNYKCLVDAVNEDHFHAKKTLEYQ